MIKKIIVQNYKLLKDITIIFNPEINILVGDNDAGKSTILEALSILTTGKLNGFAFDRQLKSNLFNKEIRNEFINKVQLGEQPIPPKIIFEAYFDGDVKYKGSNNIFGADAVGINVTVEIDGSNSETYKRMLAEKNVKDIPIELYSVSYRYFNGEEVLFRYPPFTCVFIDTTRREYSGLVDHFVSDSISDNLTDQEKIDLAVAYMGSRRKFHDNEVVKRLNEVVKNSDMVRGREISLDLREDDADAWKKQMSVVVDNIPFDHIGFGTQNIIKIELALRNANEQADIVLMEEPENNLSFSNMNFLVKHIVASKKKQVFISTHNSYIANKLNLSNVILVKDGTVCSYDKLPEETKKYFIKLPGYDTLRFVLSSKVILVEGPTDDLIIQRAYKDIHGCLPADDGIDIIAVDSLAFKRFCDIANLIDKQVIVVTDNDGNIIKNIETKYQGYIERDNIKFFYEMDEHLNTIEPSILKVNCIDGEPSITFKRIISKNGSLMKRNYNGILDYMIENKTEWAFRVFDSDENIIYPEYINNVVRYFD